MLRRVLLVVVACEMRRCVRAFALVCRDCRGRRCVRCLTLVLCASAVACFLSLTVLLMWFCWFSVAFDIALVELVDPVFGHSSPPFLQGREFSFFAVREWSGDQGAREAQDHL